MGKTPRDYMSEEAIENGKGTQVRFQEKEVKYSKIQFVKIYKGYDMLENIFTVRTYIQKHYDIDWPTLELLIKLMGMRLFTRKEYGEIPKEFGFSKFKTFLEQERIVLVSDHSDVEKRLFILSTKSKNIVTNFYMYLSGEKKIPEDYVNNPMFNSNKAVAFDKKKRELIKKMNQLPVPEHKKKLFL